MKTRTLTQEQKPHSTNRLHDAMIAAGVVPDRVESTEQESRFVFADEVADAAIDAVIESHQIETPTIPVDLAEAWQSYKTAVQNATTIPQIKAALTQELGTVLKEIAKPIIRLS